MSREHSIPTVVSLAILIGGAGILACNGTTVQSGLTGIRITIVNQSGEAVDQVRIAGRIGPESAFAPVTRPEIVGATLAAEESLVLLLPEGLAGETIFFRGDGLRGATVVASGGVAATLVQRELVEITIVLGVQVICGDGLVDPNLESCDDGNTSDGDGCNAVCFVEPGWTCNTDEPSVCVRCGDGFIEDPETCDDGERLSGDGCDAQCQTEPGWTCNGQPSRCEFTCSNGELDFGEDCDDGNLVNLDGCSDTCRNEHGWYCSGQPSACVTACNDGLIGVTAEDCDDGNNDAGDGCSPGCQLESGWSCAGEPSICDPVWGTA